MRLRLTRPAPKGLTRLFLVGALLIGLLAACAPATPPAPGVDAQPAATPVPVSLKQPATLAATAREVAVTILHTNDVRGEIDPCG